MMQKLALLALFLLVGCGADAPPTRPGVTVSGEARIGVASATPPN